MRGKNQMCHFGEEKGHVTLERKDQYIEQMEKSKKALKKGFITCVVQITKSGFLI